MAARRRRRHSSTPAPLATRATSAQGRVQTASGRLHGQGMDTPPPEVVRAAKHSHSLHAVQTRLHPVPGAPACAQTKRKPRRGESSAAARHTHPGAPAGAAPRCRRTPCPSLWRRPAPCAARSQFALGRRNRQLRLGPERFRARTRAQRRGGGAPKPHCNIKEAAAALPQRLQRVVRAEPRVGVDLRTHKA